jgi:hypothetical protein
MHRTTPCASDWQRWQQRQQQSGRPPGRTSPSPLRHPATFFPAPFPPPPSRKFAQRKANLLASTKKRIGSGAHHLSSPQFAPCPNPHSQTQVDMLAALACQRVWANEDVGAALQNLVVVA